MTYWDRRRIWSNTFYIRRYIVMDRIPLVTVKNAITNGKPDFKRQNFSLKCTWNKFHPKKKPIPTNFILRIYSGCTVYNCKHPKQIPRLSIQPCLCYSLECKTYCDTSVLGLQEVEVVWFCGQFLKRKFRERTTKLRIFPIQVHHAKKLRATRKK